MEICWPAAEDDWYEGWEWCAESESHRVGKDGGRKHQHGKHFPQCSPAPCLLKEAGEVGCNPQIQMQRHWGPFTTSFQTTCLGVIVLSSKYQKKKKKKGFYFLWMRFSKGGGLCTVGSSGQDSWMSLCSAGARVLALPRGTGGDHAQQQVLTLLQESEERLPSLATFTHHPAHTEVQGVWHCVVTCCHMEVAWARGK